MSDFLRLKFQPDTDGTGELSAEVHCSGFSGVSAAWFGEKQFTEFAKTLAATYPLPNDAPLTLSGGFWKKDDTGIEQLHVGLEFYSVGQLGKVACRVTLCTPIHENERPSSQSFVAVELEATYMQIEKFAKSLEMLVKGLSNETILATNG